MKFITVCDHNSNKTDNLKGSLKKELTCFDFNRKEGFVSRIFLFHRFLLSNKMPDNEIIIFLDGYDIICNRIEGIERDFIGSEKEVIYAAEEVSVHHDKKATEWFKETYVQHKCKFLNAGFCIGYYSGLLKMFSFIVNNFHNLCFANPDKSDQRVIANFMVRNDTLNIIKMDLDVKSVFCTTIPVCKNFDPNINSYFIHVTWLANPIQKEKYDRVVSHFFTNRS